MWDPAWALRICNCLDNVLLAGMLVILILGTLVFEKEAGEMNIYPSRGAPSASISQLGVVVG